MNKIKLFALLAILIFFMTSSCKNLEATVAHECFLIHAIQDDGKLLIPILDKYSSILNMKEEKSHPANPCYIRRSEGKSIFEISYRLGMGNFGAVL